MLTRSSLTFWPVSGGVIPAEQMDRGAARCAAPRSDARLLYQPDEPELDEDEEDDGEEAAAGGGVDWVPLLLDEPSMYVAVTFVVPLTRRCSVAAWLVVPATCHPLNGHVDESAGVCVSVASELHGRATFWLADVTVALWLPSFTTTVPQTVDPVAVMLTIREHEPADPVVVGALVPQPADTSASAAAAMTSCRIAFPSSNQHLADCSALDSLFLP